MENKTKIIWILSLVSYYFYSNHLNDYTRSTTHRVRLYKEGSKKKNSARKSVEWDSLNKIHVKLIVLQWDTHIYIYLLEEHTTALGVPTHVFIYINSSLFTAAVNHSNRCRCTCTPRHQRPPSKWPALSNYHYDSLTAINTYIYNYIYVWSTDFMQYKEKRERRAATLCAPK